MRWTWGATIGAAASEDCGSSLHKRPSAVRFPCSSTQPRRTTHISPGGEEVEVKRRGLHSSRLISRAIVEIVLGPRRLPSPLPALRGRSADRDLLTLRDSIRPVPGERDRGTPKHPASSRSVRLSRSACTLEAAHAIERRRPAHGPLAHAPPLGYDK